MDGGFGHSFSLCFNVLVQKKNIECKKEHTIFYGVNEHFIIKFFKQKEQFSLCSRNIYKHTFIYGFFGLNNKFQPKDWVVEEALDASNDIV